MAIGDDATSAGFPLVPDTGEEGRKRWGAREINRTRDLIALTKNLIPVGKPAYRAASGMTYSTGNPTGGADGDVHHRVSLGVVTTFVRHNGEWIQSGATSGGGGGEGGVSHHPFLTGRNDPNQHPISAITALQGALDSKASINDPRFDNMGGGGVTSHPELTNRNNSDQHNIASITGLSTALSTKVETTDSRLSDARTPTLHGNAQHSQNFVNGLDGVNTIRAVTEANYPASLVTGVLYIVL